MTINAERKIISLTGPNCSFANPNVCRVDVVRSLESALPTFFRTATFDTLGTGASGSSATDGYDSLAAGASAQGNTPAVSAMRAYSGTKSLRCPIGTGDTGWGFTITVPVADFSDGGEIWTRLRCYMPASFDSTTGDGTMKFFRYRVMASGGVPIASHSFNIIDTGSRTGMRTFRSDVNSDNRSFTVPDDEWATWEFYLKIHSSAGVLRAWCNGALVGETTGDTRGGSAMVSTNLDFLNYFNNGSPADQEVWIDQVEIALSGVDSPNATDGNGNIYIGHP